MFSRICGWLAYYLIAVPFLSIGMRCVYGVHIKGKRNLKKLNGAVSIGNHVHMMDCVFNAMALSPRKPVFTAMESNFKIPVAGRCLKLLGATPVPEDMHELPSFFRETKKFLKKKRIVHLYPEGHLINYYAGLRDFNRGAFAIACDAQVPVVPIVVSWRKRKGFYRLFGKTKPCATVTVCPPVVPNYLLMKREMEVDLMERSYAAMMLAYEDSGETVDYYAQRGLNPTEFMLKSNIRRQEVNAEVAASAELRAEDADEAFNVCPIESELDLSVRK